MSLQSLTNKIRFSLLFNGQLIFFTFPYSITYTKVCVCVGGGGYHPHKLVKKQQNIITTRPRNKRTSWPVVREKQTVPINHYRRQLQWASSPFCITIYAVSKFTCTSYYGWDLFLANRPVRNMDFDVRFHGLVRIAWETNVTFKVSLYFWIRDRCCIYR